MDLPSSLDKLVNLHLKFLMFEIRLLTVQAVNTVNTSLPSSSMSSSEEMRAGRRKAANMRLVVSLRPLIMAAGAEAFGLAS